MKPPKKVKVAPYEVALVFDQQAMVAAGANGAWLEDLERVLLARGNGPTLEREVVLHELLHAVWSQTELDTKYPDEEKDSPGEAIIRVLAPRLLALLRDNPRLVLYLTERV